MPFPNRKTAPPSGSYLADYKVRADRRRNGYYTQLYIRPLEPMPTATMPSAGEAALLDTGATCTLVDTAVLEKLGLHCTQPDTFIVTADGKKVPCCEFSVRIEIACDGGGFLNYEGPVRTLPGIGQPGSAAIIGLDILDRASWTEKAPGDDWLLRFAAHIEV